MLIIHPQFIKSQPFWEESHGIQPDTLIESIWGGRECSTVDTYCLYARKFLNHARESNILIQLPLRSIDVAKYLAHLKASQAKKGMITSSLAALKWLHSFVPGINAWNNPLNDDFLGKILSGYQRELGTERKQKKSLSGDMISKIISSSNLDDLTALRDCLTIAFAYSLLLRYDELSHIACSHLALESHGYKITIPKSKTDKYRNGKNVFLAKTDSHSSTFTLLSKYLHMANLAPGLNHFLFCPLKKSGQTFSLINKKLSYTSFRDIVKNAVKQIGEDESQYGTHSCRAGGATDLAPNVSEHELLVSGRWSDPRSIRSYVELSDRSRYHINEILETNLSESSR